MRTTLYFLSAVALLSAAPLMAADPASAAQPAAADAAKIADEKAAAEAKAAQLKALYDTLTQQRNKGEVEAAYKTFLDLKKIEDPVKFANFAYGFSEFVAPVHNWHRTRNADQHALAEQIRREIYEDRALPADTRVRLFSQYAAATLSRNDPAGTAAKVYEKYLELFKPEEVTDNVADTVFRALVGNSRSWGGQALVFKYAKLYKECGKGHPHSLLDNSYLPILDYELVQSKDFAAAIKGAEALLADKNFENINPKVAICKFIANVYCYQGKPREAIAFLQKQKYAPWESRFNGPIYDIYHTYLMHEEGAKFAAEQKDYGAEMSILDYKGKGGKRAIEILDDANLPGTTNDVNRLKAGLAMRFFASSNPDDQPMKKKYEKYLQFADQNAIKGKIRTAMHYCVFDDVATLAKYVPVASCDFKVAECEMYAYVALNDVESAKALITRLRELDRMTGLELNKLDFVSRLAGEKDEKGVFKKIANAQEFQKLASKDKAAIYPYAECAALVADKNTVAREAEELYNALFKDRESKIYEVPFLDKRVTGLGDLIIRKELPKAQAYDRKFGAALDFLVTDVSTGERGEGIGSEKKEQYRPSEMQIVCDDKRIHFLFTCYDSKMPEIEQGLAGGPQFEMYLSPGKNQPYYCFLPDIGSGSAGIWRSSYHTKQWKDFEDSERGQPKECKSEVIYEGDKAVFYFSLPWNVFFDKLPDADNNYDFENVEWSRFGGNSWNGLTGVHQRNSYGELKFDISQKQMLAIKRAIVIDAMKAFKMESKATAFYCGSIFRWSKDDLFGDPEFYAERMAETEKKLSDYAAMVKPGMTDETVDLLYREAVASWYNFRLILEESRADYIEDKYFKE